MHNVIHNIIHNAILQPLLNNVMFNVIYNVIHTLSITLSLSTFTLMLKMEHIGTPPEANDILSPTIIPLFGILSPPAEQEEDCHLCLETITKGQFMVFKLPCCGHYTHTECFKTWASASQVESTVRCAYCRTTYPYENTCFLCLQEYTEKLNYITAQTISYIFS